MTEPLQGWQMVPEGFIEEYVTSYEFRFDCGGGYSPTDNERAMLIDFAHGLFGELAAAPAAPSSSGVVEALKEARKRLTVWKNYLPAKDFYYIRDALDAALSATEPAGAMDALRCVDCGRPYAKGPDLVVSDEDWAKIEPKPPAKSVLCPNCMHDRFVALGVADGSVRASFKSGPFADDIGPNSQPAGEMPVVEQEPAQLRDLARQLRAVLQEHPSYAQANEIVAHCLDHLNLLAGFNERVALAPAPPSSEPVLVRTAEEDLIGKLQARVAELDEAAFSAPSEGLREVVEAFPITSEKG